VCAPWKLVVDHDHLLLSVDEEAQCIAASCVRILRDEEALDTLGELSQRRERREEVTIATLTLLDI
jgi:hypothetical protein